MGALCGVGGLSREYGTCIQVGVALYARAERGRWEGAVKTAWFEEPTGPSMQATNSKDLETVHSPSMASNKADFAAKAG